MEAEAEAERKVEEARLAERQVGEERLANPNPYP